MRIIQQRHSYVYIHSVVHLVCDLLATGIVRTASVSDRVAAVAAVQDRRHRRGRCPETSLVYCDLACAIAEFTRPGPGLAIDKRPTSNGRTTDVSSETPASVAPHPSSSAQRRSVRLPDKSSFHTHCSCASSRLPLCAPPRPALCRPCPHEE